MYQLASGLGKSVGLAWPISVPVSQDWGDGAVGRVVGFVATRGPMGKGPLPSHLSPPWSHSIFPQISASQAGNLACVEYTEIAQKLPGPRQRTMRDTHLTKLCITTLKLSTDLTVQLFCLQARTNPRNRLPSRGHLYQRKKASNLCCVHT